MVIAAAAAPAGPSWTDIMTAFGTVGAVVVAVGIALWTERRSGKRIKDERDHSDRVLADQRELDKAAIDDERAHGRAQLEEERRLAREREQLAEAYRVQVAFGQRPGKSPGVSKLGDRLPSECKQLAVMIVNHGSYTVTRVDAQFRVGRSMISPHRYERIAGLSTVPEALRGSAAWCGRSATTSRGSPEASYGGQRPVPRADTREMRHFTHGRERS